jgi:hypothetical protein
MLDVPTNVNAGLFNAVVRRLRESDTIFADRIKLVLRQLSEEQYALLQAPYLLVVPTVTRVPNLRPMDQDYESIINPRSIVFRAQLDGRGSEADWMAAVDIELVEKQLIASLVNWRPQPNYKPTAYAGMRVEATKAPQVRVGFVFTFFEELFVVECTGDEFDVEARAECADLSRARIKIVSGGVPRVTADG